MLKGIWDCVSPHLSEILLLVGVIVAGCAIRSNRDIAKKREALALIIESGQDQQMKEALQRCQEIHLDSNYDIKKLAYDYSKLTASEKKDRKQLAYMLNNFEYIAVGISANIYCEETIKNARFSTVTDAYQHTLPFIKEVRRQRSKPTYYQEFQCLACRWLKYPLKKKTVRNADG